MSKLMINWESIRGGHKVQRLTYFSPSKEADVHLKVTGHIGKVWCDDGTTIFHGAAQAAKDIFHELHAQEEAYYKEVQKRVRASYGREASWD